MRKKVVITGECTPYLEEGGDRVDRIIAWLEKNHAKIVRSNKGRVAFDFAGPHITARIEELQEKI